MPFCKQKIDEVAAEFDRCIAGVGATENGHSVEWGKLNTAKGVPVTVDHYL